DRKDVRDAEEDLRRRRVVRHVQRRTPGALRRGRRRRVRRPGDRSRHRPLARLRIRRDGLGRGGGGRRQEAPPTRGRRPAAHRPPRQPVAGPLSVGRIVTAARIEVASNQIEPALKALKKHMLKEGIFQEMKRRAFYEKPSVKRKRKQAQARKRRRKAMKRADSAGDWDR